MRMKKSIRSVKKIKACNVCVLLSMYLEAMKKNVQCFQCRRVLRRPQSANRYFIFIEAILTKYLRKKKTPVKDTNKKVEIKTVAGTSTLPISSKPQRIEPTKIVPPVQTEYPSGTSGITLQNHFSQANIQIEASSDDVPLDVPLFSAKSPIKKEPEDVKINPDLVHFKQICQNWKNYEVILKKRYPVIDRNFLWSNFWNKVILNSTTNSF